MGRRKEAAVVSDLVTLTKANPKVRNIRVKHIPKDSKGKTTRVPEGPTKPSLLEDPNQRQESYTKERGPSPGFSATEAMSSQAEKKMKKEKKQKTDSGEYVLRTLALVPLDQVKPEYRLKRKTYRAPFQPYKYGMAEMVVLNKPGPVDPPELFPDFASNMLALEQFWLPMSQARLIPAGMEDTYVTTLTHSGRGWLSPRGTALVYADSRLARLTPPSSPPSYADRGVVPVAAMATGRGKEMAGTCGGARPRARPAAMCGDHPTRPDQTWWDRTTPGPRSSTGCRIPRRGKAGPLP